MTVWTTAAKHAASFVQAVKHYLTYFLATESDDYITTEDGLLITAVDNSFQNQTKHTPSFTKPTKH